MRETDSTCLYSRPTETPVNESTNKITSGCAQCREEKKLRLRPPSERVVTRCLSEELTFKLLPREEQEEEVGTGAMTFSGKELPGMFEKLESERVAGWRK